MRKLLQRLWDIAADFANFMGGLGMRLVWLPKLHFSPGAEHMRTDPGPALFVLNHSWWMDAPMLCLLCRCRRISVVAAGEMFTGVRSLAMRSLRCIPVDRAAGADLGFFHEALRRLRAGNGCAACKLHARAHAGGLGKVNVALRPNAARGRVCIRAEQAHENGHSFAVADGAIRLEGAVRQACQQLLAAHGIVFKQITM